jgi:hypothetical protein
VSALVPKICLTQTVTISSQQSTTFPTQPFTSAPPEKVDLNYSPLLSSFGFSSPSTTATISAQDFPVFTTDSTQSTWLPSTLSSLPAQSAQQQQLKHLDLPPNQQDFVLFDQPIKPPRQLNRPGAQPLAQRGVAHSTQQHSHRNQQFYQSGSVSPSSLQGTRVASIIQATGHSPSSSAYPRFGSPVQNPQFYASSAPSSSVALHQHNSQNHSARPPVPLFTQSTGNIPQGKMNLSDFSDLEDFTAFEGGASTTYSSPAIPTVFDLTGSVSSSATNMGTVSPQDLLIHEPFMSAPNSTALTTLTSPSMYGDTSPDFADSYDVSPSFDNGDFDVPGGDAWFPLFPQESNVAAAPKPSDSPVEQSDEYDVHESIGGAVSRRKSSTNSPPSGRHSSVAGVNSRRRDKPLPPIIVEDPNDTVAMKRARNTLAARKSRERKALRFDELEEKIAKLEAERDHWKKIALSQGGQ